MSDTTGSSSNGAHSAESSNSSRSPKKARGEDGAATSSAASEASTDTSSAPTAAAAADGSTRTRKRKSGWDTTPPPAAAVGGQSASQIAAAAAANVGAAAQMQLQQQLRLKQQEEAKMQLQRQQQLMMMNQLQSQASTAAATAAKLERRVYVGSLAYELTEEHVRIPFSTWGTVTKVDMPREGNGRSKGFCFVEYTDPASANMAIRSMNGYMIGGRAIKVNKPTAVGSEPQHSGGYGHAMHHGGYKPPQQQLMGSAVPNAAQLASIPGLASLVNLPNGAGMHILQLAMSGGLPGGIHGLAAMLQAQQTGGGIATPAAIAAAALGTPAVSGAAATGGASPSALARNSGSVPQPNSDLSWTAPDAMAGSGKGRIYVGSIFWDLTAAQVKGVFDSFGKVISCQLIPNPETGKHKGYGFIEFEEDKSAAEAIDVMNGFELVGRQLKVGPAHSTSGSSTIPDSVIQASAPPSSATLPVAATAALLASGGLSAGSASVQAAIANAMGGSPGVAAAAAMQAQLAANEHGSIAREENLRISSSDRSALMQKLSRDHQSPVILLKNMVKPEEVDDDLQGEVKEECEKFGPVASVVVHLNKPLKQVHIFVCYQSSENAMKAKNALNGRWFGGSIVSAELYPKTKFDSGIFA